MNTPAPLSRAVTTARAALVAALMAAVSLPLAAATLQVSVTRADGQPAADTVVQLQPAATWRARPLPPPLVIAQKDNRFEPYITVVPVGAAVRFHNHDRWDHHVRSLAGGPLGSVAPAREFEFRLAPVRASGDRSPELRLETPGTIGLGCHIHGSMRGHLLVSATPFFGVTDARGVVRIEGVPAGQAELRLWHPEQLVEQPGVRLQVEGDASASAVLNFSPRPRRPPRPSPEDLYRY